MDHESPHQGKPASLISSGFCYQDFSSSNNNHMQSYEPSPAELFNLQTGMEILAVGAKNTGNSDNSHLEQSDDHRTHPTLWRGFEVIKSGYHGSYSKGLASETSDDFYQPSEFNKPDFSAGGFSDTSTENPMGSPETAPWQTNRLIADDSSLRYLFPGVGNDQTNQGLSLSLCNVQQSDALLPHQQQPFEHRELSNLGRVYSPLSSSYQLSHSLRSSKYLVPAQEVLIEFCNLGGSCGNSSGGSKKKNSRQNQLAEDGSSSSAAASTWNETLFSLDILELQKRKAKLLSMLEEVDRRYRRYCEQMRAVVSSFEAVAGEGSARVYSALAYKAMSRHFRGLRDGVVGQIRAVKKAMGEKDPVTPGSTRGETPRLKFLDQRLRQQKAFQQVGLMETHPWRPQRGLPERSVSILRAWLFEHFLHPYPTDVDKHILARQTGLSRSQVSNWFINARVRLWKPMVEEMYMEETKEMDNQSHHGAPAHGSRNPNPNNLEEQKPVPSQIINDSESLSSIINSNNGSYRQPPPRHHHQQQQFSSVMDIDFSSYNDCSHEQSFGNNVSLTLGLQQHTGGGMSLSFSPASQHPLFFPREAAMENCQPVQFSVLDGDGQNLPYRNLMGTQLLHDLQG